MRALFLSEGSLSNITDYENPALQPREALIRIKLAGICSTDLEIVKGYVPDFHGVLGHEFVGVVEGVAGQDETGWVGRRVVGTINLGCGHCLNCLVDGPEHCPSRRVLGIHRKDGVFADYVTLPLRNLLPVPDQLPDEAAVFTEPLAAALRIREQVRVKPTAKTAVVGPGRLGLLVGMVLTQGGTEVTMLGRREKSLELPAKLGLATGLVEAYEDDAFDFVVETTGNEAGFAHSLRLVRPLGTLILKSTFAGEATINLTKLVVGEIRVIGSRCGPFAPALRLMASGQIDPRPLIDAEFALGEGLAAFEFAARPGVRKVLIRP